MDVRGLRAVRFVSGIPAFKNLHLLVFEPLQAFMVPLCPFVPICARYVSKRSQRSAVLLEMFQAIP
jgi:hypothetical protein